MPVLESMIIGGIVKAIFGKAVIGGVVKAGAGIAIKGMMVHDAVNLVSSLNDANDIATLGAAGTDLPDNDIQGNERGRDIFGNSGGLNGQGNPGDTNIHGTRPGNVHGPF
jgi:hypothetical protein